METIFTRVVVMGVVVASLLPLALAHGVDEAVDTEDVNNNGEGSPSSDPSLDSSSYPSSYFSHPDNRGTICLHIILMSLSWVFMLPAAVMLSLARSRYTLVAQLAFLATSTTGLVFGVIYNASTPDLYPNNLHHKFGWVMMVMVAIHVVIGLTARLVGAFKGDQKTFQKDYIPVPVSRRAMDEHERLNMQHSHYQSPYRLSDESGHGSGSSKGVHTRNHSLSTIMVDEHNAIHDVGKEEEDDDDLELGEMTPPPASKGKVAWILTSVGSRISGRAWKAITVVYKILDRVLPILGFVALCTGFATFGRLFEGHGIFNGLAHWIKGGIFFWYGIFTLGRWSGSFGELGWAWNLRPRSSKSKWHVTAEFAESTLIFTYGATNIFLEHLGNWGKAWSAEDLEHISITVLFIGGGLCGMLVESTRIRDLLNVNVATKLANRQDGDEERFESRNQPPTEYAFSLNPLPALVILLVGIMMSSHSQTTAMGSMIHKQWGNLLAGASLARSLTYVLLYLRPLRSVYPSRPPTELLASFALMAGGLIFMASAGDSVNGMIMYKVNEMFVYTCVMGIVGVVMAWVILLVALKGWATRKELRSKG